jgi:hypothetical protein
VTYRTPDLAKVVSATVNEPWCTANIALGVARGV